MAQVAVMSPDGSVKKIDRDSQEGLEACGGEYKAYLSTKSKVNAGSNDRYDRRRWNATRIAGIHGSV